MWTIRVYDSMIMSKLIYGLNSLSLPHADKERIDALHFKELRQLLNLPHAYISRITNQLVLALANQRARLKKEDQS